MDNKRRMRKPVVCNVCRRRKIRCDKAKPVCSACKKANMRHMCSYDEGPGFLHLTDLGDTQEAHPLPPSFSSDSPPSSLNVHLYQDHLNLQQQQVQFQHDLYQRQHAQHAFQSQLALKYGAQVGQALTGASTVNPQMDPSYPNLSSIPAPSFIYPSSQAFPPPRPSIPAPEPLLQSPGYRTSAETPISQNDTTSQSYNPQQNYQFEFSVYHRRNFESEGRQDSLPPAPYLDVSLQQQQQRPSFALQHNSHHHQQQFPEQSQLLQNSTQNYYTYQQQQQQQQQYQYQQVQYQQHQQPLSIQQPQQQRHLPQHQEHQHPGQQQDQIQPLHASHSSKHIEPYQAGGKPNHQLSELRSDDFIDPSLFDPDEVMRSHKFNVPETKYLKVLAHGLFESFSIVKKDAFKAVFYFNIMEYGKDKPRDIAKKHSGHFQKLIENSHYHVDEYIKYEKGTLAELVKEIERKLPTKKVIWLLLDYYIATVDANLLPIFPKGELQRIISLIIGERDINSDSRTKLNVRVEDNSYILSLLYLVLIIRITQFSLICITRPNDYQSHLLKSCCASLDYDRYIYILLSIVDSTAPPDTITRLRLSLIRMFYSKFSFDASSTSSSVDITPDSLSTLAITANVNNLSLTEEDPILRQIWRCLYLFCHHTASHRGLPFTLKEDFFYVDLNEKGSAGSTVGQTIPCDKEQNALCVCVQRLLNKMNALSSVLTLSALDRLIQDYDEKIMSVQGKFKDFKLLDIPLYKKFTFTFNSFAHKQIKIGVLTLILLHFEKIGMNINAPRLMQYITEVSDLFVETFDDIFDICQNFTSYFPTGYEFFVNGGFLPQMERLLDHLSIFVHRGIVLKKPGVAVVKFYLNVIDELEGNSMLANYFGVWKTLSRLKLMLHLWKKHIKGEIDLYKLKIELDGETIDFSALPIGSNSLSHDEWAGVDKSFNRLNDRFQQSKYHDLNTIEEILGVLDFDEPAFNIDYFNAG